MRFIEWDYDHNVATEYKRSGKCLQCGKCCRTHISFQLAGKARCGDWHNGSSATIGKGVWNELNLGRWSYFFGDVTLKDTLEDAKACSWLSRKDNSCRCYEDRTRICSGWPFSLRNIEKLVGCGYGFEVVGEWEIEEDR